MASYSGFSLLAGLQLFKTLQKNRPETGAPASTLCVWSGDEIPEKVFGLFKAE